MAPLGALDLVVDEALADRLQLELARVEAQAPADPVVELELVPDEAPADPVPELVVRGAATTLARRTKPVRRVKRM